MSMWKLSSESEKETEDLYNLVRRPALFGGRRKTVQLIEQLVYRDEPAVIPAVASGLFSSDNRIHDAASLGLKRLLSLVPSLELIRLNELLGGYYYGYVSERWNEIKPKEVESFLLKTNDVAVGNLLSLHKNGYVRHAAIRFLSGVESGDELRFLLIRQNDWVDSISDDAQTMVHRKITPEYLNHFADETNLIFHLLKCKRRDLSETGSKYVNLLIAPENRNQLQTAIGSCTKKTARLLVEYLLDRKGNHLADTIRFGIASNDEIIRTKSLKHAGDYLPQNECNDIADELMSDKFNLVRQEAYELKAKRSPSSSVDVWTRCLFDKSRTLRDAAMFYLRKANCDAAAIYREKLLSVPNSLPALSGLVASGEKTDLEVFFSYLHSPFASRRAEAARGIGRVGSESDVLELQKLLLDESSRVVRAVHQQLQPIAKSIDSDFLFGLTKTCQSLAGKNAALRLLMEKGRWSSLSYLIRGLASQDHPLAKCSNELLNLTFSSNRVFTQPSAVQRKQIQLAIDESQASIADVFLSDLRSCLSSRGFNF